MKYHIRSDFKVEKCTGDCCIAKELHFTSKQDADEKAEELKECNVERTKIEYEPRAVDAYVKRYNKEINRNAGMTYHYKKYRLIREQRLIELLGKGNPEAAFAVNDGRGKLQIHEVWDTGIIFIYDFKSHKKITVFAPPPYRIKALYENAGERPPRKLMNKSHENFRKGYNKIHEA